MRRISYLFSLVILLASIGCGGQREVSTADFTDTVYAPRYAAGFDIRRSPKGASTLVAIRNPWQGAQGVEQRLLLLRDGEQAPAGFDGQAIPAPVRRVVCMSSSHVAMFDAVGKIRCVVGVSGIDYVSNPYVREHRLCGEVRDVGYDTNLDFELLTALRPDLVLLYGIAGEDPVVTGKLRELGIPYIYVGDYVEQSPLGKAEWMLVAAELTDSREEAHARFDSIAARYESLRRQIADTLDHHCPDVACRTKVLLNTPYRDAWFMPAARSYMVRLIRDAGGDTFTVSDDGTASAPVDMEQAYLLASDADVWLNVGACNTLAELKTQNPRFASIPSVLGGRVWNNNLRSTPAGGSDFWETGVVEPDRILQDLFAIFYPEYAAWRPEHYYKRLE